jgi:hypothetical protein
MPQIRDRARAVFTLRGREFEPVGDPRWVHAPPSEKRAYWNEVARLAYEARRSELLKGVGADGRKLRPRRRRRRDGATGPVLDPHWSTSRFVTNLDYQGFPDRALVFWKRPWAKIVSYHALGLVRGAPVRDVVGITPKAQERVAASARKWWSNRTRRGEDLGPLGRAHFQGPRGLPPGAVLLGQPKRASTRPQKVATPVITPGQPAYQVAQAVDAVYQAAGAGASGRRQVEQTVARLHALGAGVALEVAGRFGITGARTKAEAVTGIRRMLLERLASGLRIHRPETPPTPPTPPAAPPIPLPAPPKPAPRPGPRPRRVAVLPGVYADGELPPEVAAALPAELAGVTTFAGLARAPGGRAWWKAFGRLLWETFRKAG